MNYETYEIQPMKTKALLTKIICFIKDLEKGNFPPLEPIQLYEDASLSVNNFFRIRCVTFDNFLVPLMPL